MALYVNATLNGVTKEGTATLTISSTSAPTLASVSITPSSPLVTVGATQTFTATPTCNGGACPPGTTYTWRLNNSLGNLSSATGPSTIFTAGSKTGTVALFVNATLNGKIVQSSPVVITIKASSPSPTPGFLGLSGNLGYIVIGVIVVVAAIAAVLLLMRRKKGTTASPPAGSVSQARASLRQPPEHPPG